LDQATYLHRLALARWVAAFLVADPRLLTIG